MLLDCACQLRAQEEGPNIATARGGADKQRAPVRVRGQAPDVVGTCLDDVPCRASKAASGARLRDLNSRSGTSAIAHRSRLPCDDGCSLDFMDSHYSSHERVLALTFLDENSFHESRDYPNVDGLPLKVHGSGVWIHDITLFLNFHLLCPSPMV